MAKVIEWWLTHGEESWRLTSKHRPSYRGASVPNTYAQGRSQEVVEARRITEGVTVPMVMRATIEHFNVPVDVLSHESRNAIIARIRAIAMFVCRSKTNASYPEIGRAFGGRHHTTVIAAVQKIDREWQEYAGDVLAVTRRVHAMRG